MDDGDECDDIDGCGRDVKVTYYVRVVIAPILNLNLIVSNGAKIKMALARRTTQATPFATD